MGVGKQGDTCWLAMEYVEGEPLTKVIERIGTLKMLEWRFALGVGGHIAHALEAAYEKYIIHRNVSPESILIRAKDKVAALGDMMLAKAFEGIKAKQITRIRVSWSGISPTWHLSAPRATSKSIPRRPVRTGGNSLRVLTGKPPFEGKTLVETIAQDPAVRSRSAQEVPALDSGQVSRRRDDVAGQAARSFATRPRPRRAGARARREVSRGLRVGFSTQHSQGPPVDRNGNRPIPTLPYRGLNGGAQPCMP